MKGYRLTVDLTMELEYDDENLCDKAYGDILRLIENGYNGRVTINKERVEECDFEYYGEPDED